MHLGGLRIYLCFISEPTTLVYVVIHDLQSGEFKQAQSKMFHFPKGEDGVKTIFLTPRIHRICSTVMSHSYPH